MPIILQPNRFPNIPQKPGVYLVSNSYNDREYVGHSPDLNRAIANLYPLNGNINGPLKGLDMSKCTVTILETTEYLDKDQRCQIALEWILRLSTVYPAGYNKRCPVYRISFIMKEAYLNGPKEQPKKYKYNVKKKRKYIPRYKLIGKNVLRDY